MFDADLGALGYLEALAGDLDAEAFARLEGVSQAAELGHELRHRIVAFDVSGHGLIIYRAADPSASESMRP